MNRDWYRMVVRSVRWSPEKRAEIIERLKAVDDEAEWNAALDISNVLPDDDWEKELNDPEEAYRQQRREMMEAREYDMKHRRMRRIMTIGLLAATLATGGAIGAAVAYAKKHPQTLNITWKNGITLNLTAQEFEEPFGMNYYADPNYDSFNDIITETDTGWFYRKQVVDEPLEDQPIWYLSSQSTSTLFYMDEETGQTVPVCAKPNCLHDGNEYCTATTFTYALSYLTYYDGYLYAVTTKYLSEPDEHYNHNFLQACDSIDNCKQVLIRISPDGTEITELAEFGTGLGSMKCIVHRGYVWCIVQRQERGERVENPITHDMQTFESGGWQLWGYELATGKSAILFDAMSDPTVNHVNKAPSDLTASGDYLYFERTDGDWSGAQGLCRLSLLTGEITNGNEEVLITGRHLVCMSKTHAIRSKQIKTEDGEVAWEDYLIDLETREETYLGNSVELAEKASTDEYKPDILSIAFMNNDYLFAYARGTNKLATEPTDDYLFVLDYDGNIIKTVKTGFICDSLDKTEKNEDGYQRERVFTEYENILGVTDDRVYYLHSISGTTNELEARGKERTQDVLYCTIDSLLNDETPDWHFAYSVLEEVRGNAQ